MTQPDHKYLVLKKYPTSDYSEQMFGSKEIHYWLFSTDICNIRIHTCSEWKLQERLSLSVYLIWLEMPNASRDLKSATKLTPRSWCPTKKIRGQAKFSVIWMKNTIQGRAWDRDIILLDDIYNIFFKFSIFYIYFYIYWNWIFPNKDHTFIYISVPFYIIKNWPRNTNLPDVVLYTVII